MGASLAWLRRLLFKACSLGSLDSVGFDFCLGGDFFDLGIFLELVLSACLVFGDLLTFGFLGVGFTTIGLVLGVAFCGTFLLEGLGENMSSLSTLLGFSIFCFFWAGVELILVDFLFEVACATTCSVFLLIFLTLSFSLISTIALSLIKSVMDFNLFFIRLTLSLSTFTSTFFLTMPSTFFLTIASTFFLTITHFF